MLLLACFSLPDYGRGYLTSREWSIERAGIESLFQHRDSRGRPSCFRVSEGLPEVTISCGI